MSIIPTVYLRMNTFEMQSSQLTGIAKFPALIYLTRLHDRHSKQPRKVTDSLLYVVYKTFVSEV